MLQPWFPKAKFGISIHYGIYAVNGIQESWSFKNGDISYEDYMKQLEGFTASRYDPEVWAKLFKEAGARYVVLTTKHHDGVALFDTQLSDLSVVKKTPAKRDLVAPYCEALRKYGLRVGLYFSHLDWSHPDYASWLHTGLAPEYRTDYWDYPRGEPDRARWDRFIQFHQGQLKELCSNYGKVDLLYFDGDWSRDAADWKFPELRKLLHEWQPEVILNSRMGRWEVPPELPYNYGDYATPEQSIPTVPPQGPWEFFFTMNDTWSYQPHDTNWKSVQQLVWYLTNVIGRGGNLLLNVGPREDGSIPDEQVERLRGIGDWIRRNEACVYDTVAGLPAGLYGGPSMLSTDSRKLYLVYFGAPTGPIPVSGIISKVASARVLGTGEKLTVNAIGQLHGRAGVCWVSAPSAASLDPVATVLELAFDEPVQLSLTKGDAITQN